MESVYIFRYLLISEILMILRYHDSLTAQSLLCVHAPLTF